MNTNSKIIFIDADGTLISYQKYLPESAKQAIIEARKNNHQVILCTGRSAIQIIPEIFNIGFDGYILGNGAFVAYKKKLIIHTPIPEETYIKVEEYFKYKDISYYFETNDGLFLSKNFEKKGNLAFQKYAKYCGNQNYKDITIYDSLVGITNKPFVEHKVNRISYILNNQDDYINVKNEFPTLSHGLWGCLDIEPIFGYICMPEISKGEGIRHILDVSDVSMWDSISIGDSNIDISMFQNTAYSVCMGNGTDDAKRIANYVTDSLENDGLYKAFKYLKLI